MPALHHLPAFLSCNRVVSFRCFQASKVTTVSAEQFQQMRGDDELPKKSAEEPPVIPPPTGLATPPDSVWTKKAKERAAASQTVVRFCGYCGIFLKLSKFKFDGSCILFDSLLTFPLTNFIHRKILGNHDFTLFPQYSPIFPYQILSTVLSF